MTMSSRKMIAIGAVLGVAVEAIAVVVSLSGTNLFHGGHLSPIVNVLLPGLGIAERLPRGTPGYVFGTLVIISILQFPLYGALAGHYYVRRQLSTITKAVFTAHAAGAAVAIAAAFLIGYG